MRAALVLAVFMVGCGATSPLSPSEAFSGPWNATLTFTDDANRLKFTVRGLASLRHAGASITGTLHFERGFNARIDRGTITPDSFLRASVSLQRGPCRGVGFFTGSTAGSPLVWTTPVISSDNCPGVVLSAITLTLTR